MLRTALFMYLGVGCLIDAWLIKNGMYEELSDEVIPKYGDNLKTRAAIAYVHLMVILISPAKFAKTFVEESSKRFKEDKHGN